MLKNKKKSIILFFSGVLMCLSYGFFFLAKDSGTLHVSFIDVGQGDSIFIQTPSHKTMVVDGGPGNASMRTISHEVPFFTNTIDVMVATHPDADHVTGLIDVLQKYKVRTIVVSPAKSDTGVFAKLNEAILEEEKEGAQVHVGNAGDSIDFGDGVNFTIVSPPTDIWHGEDTNSESVTGLLAYKDRTFLLTGDLPSTREGETLARGMLPRDITVLKAGHHGSKYSSSDMFLNYVKPTYAIISAGKDNRYGHPNEETIGRLQKVTKNILSTIDSGTISFKTNGNDVNIETDR